MTEPADFPTQIDEDNKNKTSLRCQFCNSLILLKKCGDFVKKEYQLPLMHQKNSSQEVEKEPVEDFWQIANMYTFENIGFSHSVENVKYLICADCEMGPVGFQDQADKLCYISLLRVKHVEN